MLDFRLVVDEINARHKTPDGRRSAFLVSTLLGTTDHRPRQDQTESAEKTEQQVRAIVVCIHRDIEEMMLSKRSDKVDCNALICATRKPPRVPRDTSQSLPRRDNDMCLFDLWIYLRLYSSAHRHLRDGV